MRVPAGRRSLSAPSLAELLDASTSLAWHLPSLLREFQPDGVLAFFAIPSGWLALRAGRRLGVPILVSLRGSDVPGFPGRRISPLIRPLTRHLVRQTLRSADLVVPNCEYLRELAVAFEPAVRHRSLVIGNGLSKDWLASEPAGSDSGELHLVTVGQLIARKRIELALVALRRLSDSGVPARLTVIGDGPRRKALQQQAASLRISSRVDFLGYQSREQVQRLLRQHNAFLFTSESEGMSNAVLEAMASGLPIVSTGNASGSLVTSAGCGQSVAADDGAGLIGALERLYVDESYRCQLAWAGIGYARHRTWRHSAEQFLAALDHLQACGAVHEQLASPPANPITSANDGEPAYAPPSTGPAVPAQSSVQ